MLILHADLDEVKQMGLKKFMEKVYKKAAMVEKVYMVQSKFGDKLPNPCTGLSL